MDVIAEGTNVKINNNFHHYHKHTPNWAGKPGVIEVSPNGRNCMTGYIVQIFVDGVTHRRWLPVEGFTVVEDDGLVEVIFTHCSIDGSWEFSAPDYARATVRFPEVLYPLSLFWDMYDTKQVRRIKPEMIPALRYEE
jgi:hypothetical protein